MTAWHPIQTAYRVLGDKVWVFDARAGVVLSRYVLIPHDRQSDGNEEDAHPGWRAVEFTSGELTPIYWAAHTPGEPQPDWPATEVQQIPA
jgi:hypothetical protein